MPNEESVIVHTRSVACNGEGGLFGHPVNYIAIGSDNRATCQYCGRNFVYKEK